MKNYECVMYIIFDIGIDLKYLKVLQKKNLILHMQVD
jgi:hypothetical protein